jgi:hypothetical protein
LGQDIGEDYAQLEMVFSELSRHINLPELRGLFEEYCRKILNTG